MAEIWIVRTRARDAGAMAGEAGLATLGEAERRHARAEPTPTRRAAYIAARAALRLILCKFEPGLAAGAPLERGRHGKPFLAGGPHFSFSATGGAALVAIDPDGPVGADIERVRDVAGAEAALARIPALRRHAGELGGGDGGGVGGAAMRFLAAWTRFEAALKAGGGSLGPSLADLDTGWSGAPARRSAAGSSADFAVTPIEAGHGYVAACAHRPGARLTIREFDWSGRRP